MTKKTKRLLDRRTRERSGKLATADVMFCMSSDNAYAKTLAGSPIYASKQTTRAQYRRRDTVVCIWCTSSLLNPHGEAQRAQASPPMRLAASDNERNTSTRYFIGSRICRFATTRVWSALGTCLPLGSDQTSASCSQVLPQHLRVRFWQELPR